MSDHNTTPPTPQERGRHFLASAHGAAFVIVTMQGRVVSAEGTEALPADRIAPANGQNWFAWLSSPWRGRMRLAIEELAHGQQAPISLTLPDGIRVQGFLERITEGGTASSSILVMLRKLSGLGQVDFESLLDETGVGAFYLNLVLGTLVGYRPEAPSGQPRITEGPLSGSTFFTDLALEGYDVMGALAGLASQGGQLSAEGIYSPTLGRFVTLKAYCEESSERTTAIQGFIKVWDDVIPDTRQASGGALATLESDVNGGQIRLRARHQGGRHAGRIIKALVEQLLADSSRRDSLFRRHCQENIKAGGASLPPLPYRVEVDRGLEWVELRTRPRYDDRLTLNGLIHAVYESFMGDTASDPSVDNTGQVVGTPTPTESASDTVQAHARRQVQEAHHRIKNSISILTGLMQLQAAEAGQVESDVLQATMQRMMTLADLHESLYEVGMTDQGSMGIKTYLDKLLSRTAGTILRPGLSLSWDIEDHALPARTCATIGMLLTELIQNAIKHAFDRDKEGKIYTSFYAEGTQYYLAIQDNGKGMSQGKAQEASQGLGSVLIGEFVSELGGSIRREGALGTRVIVSFPQVANA